MAQVFQDDDEGFRNWRDGHADGYIGNIPISKSKQSWKSINTHKANCRSVKKNSFHGDSGWTVNKYLKIGGKDLQIIDDWIRKNTTLPTDMKAHRCGNKCMS